MIDQDIISHNLLHLYTNAFNFLKKKKWAHRSDVEDEVEE